MIVLAHPLTEAAGFGVAPAFVAAAALAVTVGTAELAVRYAPAGRRVMVPGERRGPVWIAGRVVGLALFALAILAGRLGPPGQLDTITTALVIGAGWPLLLLVSLLVGDVWRWVNPFDTLARGLEGLTGDARRSRPPPPVSWLGWVSVLGAAGWCAWLVGYPSGLEPRTIALALSAYTLLTLVGCLAVGRRVWLSQAEFVTVALTAIAGLGRRTPEPGGVDATTATPVGHRPAHQALLGVLAGGLLLGELRYSGWWIHQLDQMGVDPFGDVVVWTAFSTALLVGAGVTRAAVAWARRENAAPAVLTVMAGVVVGLGVAFGIERDRLWTSLQLLVMRGPNPLGGETDPLGTGQWVLQPWPWSDEARALVQVAVLVVCGAVALARVRRASVGRGTQAATMTLVGWLAVALLSVATV